MAISFYSGEKKKKRVTLTVVAAVLLAVLIAFNAVLASPLGGFIHQWMAGTAYTPPDEATVNDADAVIREIAEESMVLIKNDDGFLPRPANEKFNLFGWASTDQGFQLVGGGSGGTTVDVDEERYVSLAEAFRDADVEINEDLYQEYSDYSAVDADGGATGADNDRGWINPDAGWYTQELMQNAHDFSTTAVVVLNRWGAENGGNGELLNLGSGKASGGTYLELSANEKAMFQKLQEYNFNVVVLLNTTNPIEFGAFEQYTNIKSILYVGIPGQSGASAIPRILTGEINPSGKLADTYAKDWQTHNPTFNNTVSVNNNISYKEGIYIGYKWYETAYTAGYFERVGTTYEDVVAYPFGHGLSYTTFSKEIIADASAYDVETHPELEGTTPFFQASTIDPAQKYSVIVRVKNTGDVAGREVAELYFTPPYDDSSSNNQVEAASVNLLAFNKTDLLYPAGDEKHASEQDVVLTFTGYDLASYDAYDMDSNNFAGYELLKGVYTVSLRDNAHVVTELPADAAVSSTNEIVVNIPDIVRIENDPITGKKVENRFTGSNAYANSPIDGGFTYLSRKDQFANFNSATAQQNPASAYSNPNYAYPGDSTDTSDIQYGQDNGLYLTTVFGDKPYLQELGGVKDVAASEDLMRDDDLFEELDDWNSETWDPFLDQLRQDTIRSLIYIGGFRTIALEEVGKPRCTDSDGPAGFNDNVMHAGETCIFPVFPAETLSGCSWSTRLMYYLGRVQGNVGVSVGRQGWYAPGVNLHRSVYNSRNYEYYSEDPVLSGKLAARTVLGAKRSNLYCYVKHFVLSDNGQNAQNWPEWVTEQALRENYLKPFEICVKEGEANAMMSAFNRLGSVWCGYNHALLTDVLRTEWGFHGSVVTDWGQGYMYELGRGVKAGNDLWLVNDVNDYAGDGGSSNRLNFNDPAVACAVRQSVKGILYTYVDTYVAAKKYSELPPEEKEEDAFDVDLSVNVNNARTSPLFTALWAVGDVVLCLGIAACVVFMFVSKKKKTSDEPTESNE